MGIAGVKSLNTLNSNNLLTLNLNLKLMIKIMLEQCLISYLTNKNKLINMFLVSIVGLS